MVPAALRARGVMVMLHPERVRVRPPLDPNAEIGLGGEGQLVLRVPGGLLGAARIVEVDRSELTIERGPEGLLISGGPLTELVLRTDPASAVHRTWLERAPFGLGPDWTLVGSGSVQVLTLDPQDPRKPPRATPFGKPRATATVWRRGDGAMRLDAVQEVVEVPPERVHAISVPAPKALVVHTFQRGLDGWRVGYRLQLGDPSLQPLGLAPDAVVAARFVGRVGGEPIEATLAARAAGTLHLLDEDAGLLASVPLSTARFTTEPRLLLLGPQLDLVADLPSDVARWLVEGTVEDPEVLEVVGAGAARARLLDGVLTLIGTRDHRVSLADLDPSAIVVERDGSVGRLALGPLSVRGSADALGRLREAVLAQGGRAALERADRAELLEIRRALRVDRWLWMIYGGVFVTERLLTDPATPEPGEDADRQARRRMITEALLVAEQARALRLRAGLGPVALPWALTGDAATRLALRTHLRECYASVAFPLAEIEATLPDLTALGARLDPPLDPGQAGPTPAAIKKAMEALPRDFATRMALERAAPRLRPGWELLARVAAATAAETDAWLGAWLEASGATESREALTDEILALQAAAALPLPAIPGCAVGDVTDRIRALMAAAPGALLDQLVGPS